MPSWRVLVSLSSAFSSVGGSWTQRVAEPTPTQPLRPPGPWGGQNQPRGCKMDAGRTSVAFEALASSLPSHSSPSRPLFSHPLLHLPPVDPHLYPQVPSQLLHLAPSCLSTARSPRGGGKPSILSRTSDLCVNTLW